MDEKYPFSSFRLTARIELSNKPGTFAKVAVMLAEKNANLGSVETVEVTKDKVVRDITFDVAGENEGDVVLELLRQMEDVNVISGVDRIFLLHDKGKICIQSKIPLKTRNQLSMAYTPGVARVCEAIAKDPSRVYDLTIKANTVAIVTDGSAILGLGNLGPEAALPVMEGKAMLFKEFAGIDAWPICLASQDTEEIIKAVELLAPVFGGINLEDISSPRCFEIEARLKKSLDIPVMHDDQHGTAVVILAALKNALKIVKKDIHDIKIVISGMGAAGVACCQMLLASGAENIQACNRKGVIFETNAKTVSEIRKNVFPFIRRDHPTITLKEAVVGADVFIGLSVANLLNGDDLKTMKKDPIVFAMANPNPEVDPKDAEKYCRVYATGRSDYANQINNALAFPGIFKGALNVRAKSINEQMKMAASQAIADLVSKDELKEEYIIPSIFDTRVVEAVTRAVSEAAYKTKVA